MELYVVRHGTTDNNVYNLINGRNDIDLNEQGIKDAEMAMQILKDIDFSVIYCSPLIRTKHTMEIINCKNIPVIYEEDLMERDAGVMTNRPVSELDLNLWENINIGRIYGGSESFKESIERVSSFLEKIKEKHKDEIVLLVTHGGIMKAIEVYLFGYPGIERINNWRHPNCAIRQYYL